MSFYIGIDPGLTGAMALLCSERGLLACVDLPTESNGLKTGSMKRQLDAAEFDRQMIEWRITHDLAYEHVTVMVERPIAMPSLPAQTIAAQFDTVGAIRALCSLRFNATNFVAPSEWKKLFGLKGGKEAKDGSREAALRLYPSAPVARVKDHNRAEAVLIAHWAKVKLA
jgi:crossover junction endodeoxyribonuclease RuvC